jgi:hypothetical protein
MFSKEPVRIFVLEDIEKYPVFPSGFYDLILPGIQETLNETNRNALVLWGKSQPEIKSSPPVLGRCKQHGYRYYRVTHRSFKEITVDEDYPLYDFNLFILDNSISGIHNAGWRFGKKVIETYPQAKIILFSQYPLPSYSHNNILRLDKKTEGNLFSEQIRACIELIDLTVLVDKVAVYCQDNEKNKLSEKSADIIESILTFKKPINKPEELMFLKGYIEILNSASDSDVERLINLANNCSTPIAICAEWESGTQINRIKSAGIIEFELEDIDYYLHRFLRSPNIIGCDRMAKILQDIVLTTRDIMTTKEGGRGIFITGDIGTGKELVAKMCNALTTHNDNYEDMVTLDVGLPKDELREKLFGIGPYWTAGDMRAKDREREGLIESTKDKTLFIDELQAMDTSAQSNFLRIVEYGGPYTRDKDNPKNVLYVDNVKFIFATNEEVKDVNIRKDLFSRCKHIHVPPVLKKEIIPLAKYFTYTSSKGTKALSQSIIVQIVQSEWKNVRTLKEYIEKIVKTTVFWMVNLNDLNTIPKIETVIVNKKSEGIFKESITDKGSISDYVKIWYKHLGNEQNSKVSLEDIFKGLPDGTKYSGTGYAGCGVIEHLARSYVKWPKLGKQLKTSPKVNKGFVFRKGEELLKKLNKQPKEYILVFLNKNIGFAKVQGDDKQKISDTIYYDFVVVEKKTKNVLAPENNNLERLVKLDSEKLKEFDVKMIINYRSVQGNKAKRKVEIKNDSN